MKVNWKRTTKETGRLNVKLRGMEWKKAQEDSYKSLSEEVNSSDFKRGYAPKKIKDSLITDEQILVYAIELVSQNLLAKALLEADIAIVGHPELEVNEVSKTKLDIDFVCTLRPEIELANYRDIDVSDVPKEEINKMIVERVIKGSKLEIPDSLIRLEANQFTEKFLELTNSESLQNYAASQNGDYDDLRKQIFEASKELVKERLILEEIATKEDIKVDAKDIENEYHELAKENEMTIEEMKEKVDIVLISHSALMKKTTKFLIVANTL